MDRKNGKPARSSCIIYGVHLQRWWFPGSSFPIRIWGAFTKGITPDPHPKWADITEDAEETRRVPGIFGKIHKEVTGICNDELLPRGWIVTAPQWCCWPQNTYNPIGLEGDPRGERLQGSVENIKQTSNVVTKSCKTYVRHVPRVFRL